MFGNHDFETATTIAADKTAETGKRHTALPSPDEEGKWTIGVEVKTMSGADLIKRIKGNPT